MSKLLAFMMICISVPVVYAGSVSLQNSMTCMNWVLQEYPEFKDKIKYFPEHNLLVQKYRHAQVGQIRLFHTGGGSSVHLDDRNEMHCRPKIGALGDSGTTKDGVNGIDDFISFAINNRLQNLEFDASVGNTRQAISFMQRMPVACYWSHYSRVHSVVNYHCNFLRNEVSSLLAGAVPVCKESGR